MRIIHLTMHESSGAGRAALRIHKGLVDNGIESSALVLEKTSDIATVIGLKGMLGLCVRLKSMVVNLFIGRFFKKEIIFSVNLLPSLILKQIRENNPDIIHLHWIGWEFIRIEDIKKINRPIIWTLHDSWAFTGGCHIPFDCKRYRESCGKCPVLGSSKDIDLSRWTLQRKKKALKDLNLTVVTPSRWLSECAKSSSLFQESRVEVIPNGLDIQLFKPVDKRTARNILSLSQDKKLIVFGAIRSTSDRNKGFQFIPPALKILAEKGWGDKAELIVFGSREPENAPEFGMKARYIGKLNDEVSLTLLYSAADIFVLPSIQENLPNTVMEAMACRTPCVAFNQGGLPDLIEHKRNGYLVRPFETEDLARGIAWVLEDDERWTSLSLRAREKVEDEFSVEKVAKRYADLYKEILEKV